RAKRVFTRRSWLSYTKTIALRARVSKIRRITPRRFCGVAISVLDLLASSAHCLSLALLIVRERVSIVHSNNSVEAIVAAFLTRRPVLYHLHGVAVRRP